MCVFFLHKNGISFRHLKQFETSSSCSKKCHLPAVLFVLSKDLHMGQVIHFSTEEYYFQQQNFLNLSFISPGFSHYVPYIVIFLPLTLIFLRWKSKNRDTSHHFFMSSLGSSHCPFVQHPLPNSPVSCPSKFQSQFPHFTDPA